MRRLSAAMHHEACACLLAFMRMPVRPGCACAVVEASTLRSFLRVVSPFRGGTSGFGYSTFVAYINGASCQGTAQACVGGVP